MRSLDIHSRLGRAVPAGLLAAALAGPAFATVSGGAAAQAAAQGPSIINFIGHEASVQGTRVIFHASGPIDYRGGSLRSGQVIIDLANVGTALPSPVVEIGTPQVDRVVIGPELDRDGTRVLKVRLTGVKARSHKVQQKDNELLVDLEAQKGAGDEKGLPKVIREETDSTATVASSPAGTAPAIRHAAAGAVPAAVPNASRSRSGPDEGRRQERLAAVPAGDAIVTRVARTAAATSASGGGQAASTPVPAVSTSGVAPASPVEPAGAGAAQAAATSTSAQYAASVAPPSRLSMPPMALAAEGDAAATRSLAVAVGRSLTVEAAAPFARVSVSNPAVAEPVAISPTQLVVNGLKPGVVSLVMWPKEGQPIVYELIVHIDHRALEQQMQAIFPSERVRVQTSKDSIVLTGPVSSADVAGKIKQLASDYSEKVIDHMMGPGASRKQVMLKVKFAEVSKQALTELAAVLHRVDPTRPLGADRGSAGTGEFSPPGGNLLNDPLGPELTWGDAINLSFFEKSLDLGLFLTALKTRGLFQELAEPTLISADGQEASFLAGGEFPVPVAQPGANFVAITVVWKKFGISLDFKPTILNDGVIVMRVKPEVSSLDFSNGVLIEGFRIPALVVRRAETEVELRDGQSFAIAGLYDRNLLQTKSKIPVLGDIPLLGYLFRSKNLQKSRTELLVIVTPTIVEPLGAGRETPSIEMAEPFDLEPPAKGGRR